tara:strand:+ start:345 stop:1094 length:750 start_codon:yes stop_codon:yes gene_type:complete
MLINKILSLKRLFKFYFIYTARPKYINPIFFLRKIADKSDEKKLERIKGGKLKKIIDTARSKSDSTGCNYSDYLNLYELVKKHKPRNILELGPGISSCVLAYALKENEIEGYEPGIITCMEESEYYFDNFKKIIPDEYIEVIKPIYSPRKTAYFENNFGCFYSNIPGKNFDMIFIDGPHTTFPEEPEKAFDADLINLIKDKKIKDSLVILDQRVSTLEILNELISGLNLKYNPLKMVSIGRIKNLENQD